MAPDAVNLPWQESADGPCIMAAPHLQDWQHALTAYLNRLNVGPLIGFASSGSSGTLPKAILFTRRALDVCALGAVEHLRMQTGDWCCPLPIYHVGGAMIHFRAACTGAHVYTLHGKWDPSAYTRLMTESGAAWSSLVPTQVIDLIQAGCQAPDSVRCIIVGGGALAPALGEQARQLGWPVVQSYGMTEAGSQIATARTNDPYTGKKLPILPHWSVGTDANGCLTLSGDGLPSAIVRSDRNGHFSFEQLLPGVPLATRDKVQLNHGTLTFLNRADRLTKILGELINPDDIEQRLQHTLPGVIVEVLPHERDGSQLIACGPDPVALSALCREWNIEAPGPMRIRAVFATEIPHNSMGKIARSRLCDMIESAPQNLISTKTP